MFHIKRRNFACCLPLAFALAEAACALAQSPQERMAQVHLEDARAAHMLAKADPEMQAEALPALMDAEQTLNAAAHARDVDEIHHLAYIAQRQTQIAVSLAHLEQSRRVGDELRLENDRLMQQASAHSEEGA